MLTFLLNNKPFVLNLDTSVRITWLNPACMFDDFPGDVGMGVDIPVNETNRAMLGNPERFEKYTNTTAREFPNFEIRFGGILLLGGTLVITDASQENYNGWLRSNVGNLGKEHREKYIYDIDAFNTDVTFVNKANYDPLTDPYGCPIVMNPEFFRDKGRMIEVDITVPNPDYYPGSGLDQFIPDKKETEALSEAFRRTASYIVNYLNPDNTVKTSTSESAGDQYESQLDVYVVSPMLFLNYVLETILKDAGFFLDDNFIKDHADLQKLILYNNYDITNFEFSTFTTPTDSQIWPDNMMVRIGLPHKIDLITRNYTDTFKYKNLLPKITLKDFILSIQNELNVCFHFKHLGKVDVIDRETILTGDVIDISKYMLNNWEMGERKDLTLKFIFDHDDDDNVFKERWEDVDDRRPDEGEPVDTWADLNLISNPAVGEMRYIKSENMYVQYAWTQLTTPDPRAGTEKQEDVLGWEHLATNFQNGYYNKDKAEEEKIETNFSTLAATQDSYTYQRGNIKSMKFAYQNFTPRLMFYTGNNRAKFETANVSLDWEKETTGLLKTRYPKWARFWAHRQPVTGKAQLPLNVIDNIIRNITKKQRSNEGEFIVEKIETSFSIDKIGVTNITGYKI